MVFIVGVIIVLLYLFIYIKYRDDSILYLPLLFVVLEIFRVILELHGSIVGYNINIIILLILVIVLHQRDRVKIIYILPLIIYIIMVIYLVLRIDVTDINSISRYLLFILLLYIILLVSNIKKELDGIVFKRGIYASIAVSVIYVIICSILKIGPNHYDTGIIYGFAYEQWYMMSLWGIILVHFIKSDSNKRYFNIFLFIVILVIVVLTFRRTALLIMLLGSLLYIININSVKQITIMILLLLFILLGNHYFSKALLQIRYVEQENITELEDESRFLEIYTSYETLSNIDKGFVYGYGSLFNEYGKYGFPNIERGIHGTYTRVWFGSGVIGLLLFVSYLLSILYLIFISSFKKINYKRLGLILLIAYIIAAIPGASGQGAGIAYVGGSFVIIGYLINSSCTKK
jgi:O-antigen ligase